MEQIEEEITKLKQNGNKSFGQKDYSSAIKYYTQGLQHNIFTKHNNDNNNLNETLIKLLQSLLLNRAKAYFKSENLKNALIDTSTCIQTSNSTKMAFKAHFTRAEIYGTLNDAKNAIVHCDNILRAPKDLKITELQNRAKTYKRQIMEKSMSNAAKAKSKTKSSKLSKRKKKILTVGQHRDMIEILQFDDKNNQKEAGIMVSSIWWRKWHDIPHDLIIDNNNTSILNVDNSDLIESEEKEHDIKTNDDNDGNDNNDMIEIEYKTYLCYNLRKNLKLGKANDYIILNFASYQKMIQLNYKFKPQPIWIRNVEQYNPISNKIEKKFELYKSKYNIYFNDKKVNLLCSKNETIRKICIEIARHFIIQSSSIRLRYKTNKGIILDRSHTLTQHKIECKYSIYIEIRLPNGCWPIKTDLDNYHGNNNNNNDNSNKKVCFACHRLISHSIDCPKKMLNNQCKAQYCNNKHISSHWKYHEYLHKIKFQRDQNWGLVGLQNLGNTCYMNSSLQCLSHIAELRSYLISNDYIEDINKDNPLGYNGKLAVSFAEFLKKQWFGTQDIISPSNIRKQIAMLSEQWNSTQQQDAEEFVRWLLDGLHEDLNLILKKPYYELPDSDGRSDDIVSNEHWQLHLKRNQSMIVDLFQGQYKSTLTCPICNHKSVKFDAFSSLSLPIPDKDTMISVNCLIFSNNLSKYPYKLNVNVSAKADVTQLTNILSEKLNEYEEKELYDAKNLLCCRVIQNKFGKYWSSGRPIKKVLNKSNDIFTYIYQVKTTTIAKRKETNLVQIRMNFCYKPIIDSSPSDDSDDDYNNNYNHIKKLQSQSQPQRIFFSHPMVFDILLTEFTGNNIYEYFKLRLLSFINIKQEPPIPDVRIYLKLSDGKEEEIEFNDKELSLTNKSRNVATINIEFSEREYKLYINQTKAIKFNTDIDNKLSDDKISHDIDVYDCLKLYTASEVLDDNNWKCSKCNKKTQPSKQLHLWRLPEILIIHLKRFINAQGVFGGIGKKNQSPVKTPINGLDLKPYLSNTIDDINNLDIPKYDLFAVVNHSGLMEFGHYYSIVRTDYSTQITNFYQYYKEVDKPTWNLFNDSKVQKLHNIDDLEMYTKDAYLLFYRRRNNV